MRFVGLGIKGDVHNSILPAKKLVFSEMSFHHRAHLFPPAEAASAHAHHTLPPADSSSRIGGLQCLAHGYIAQRIITRALCCVAKDRLVEILSPPPDTTKLHWIQQDKDRLPKLKLGPFRLDSSPEIAEFNSPPLRMLVSK